MNCYVTVCLFGSLRHAGGRDPQCQIPLSLGASVGLDELIEELRLPADKIGLVMVNHAAVPMGHLVQPGDRVSLFPKDYAVFADWKNFRSPFPAR